MTRDEAATSEIPLNTNALFLYDCLLEVWCGPRDVTKKAGSVGDTSDLLCNMFGSKLCPDIDFS
jgi:hypothetical protein